jgi:hypothetical protein
MAFREQMRMVPAAPPHSSLSGRTRQIRSTGRCSWSETRSSCLMRWVALPQTPLLASPTPRTARTCHSIAHGSCWFIDVVWFLSWLQVVLYESDLDDNGVSQLSVKLRVMPRAWLVLLRSVLQAGPTYPTYVFCLWHWCHSGVLPLKAASQALL